MCLSGSIEVPTIIDHDVLIHLVRGSIYNVGIKKEGVNAVSMIRFLVTQTLLQLIGDLEKLPIQQACESIVS